MKPNSKRPFTRTRIVVFIKVFFSCFLLLPTLLFTYLPKEGKDAIGNQTFLKQANNLNHEETIDEDISDEIVVNLGASLIYNGEAQTQEIEQVLYGTIEVPYLVENNIQTNAGTYTMVLSGSGEYKFRKEVSFTIAKKTLNITQDFTSFTYSGFSQSYMPGGFLPELMTISNHEHTDAGLYIVRVELKDTENYEWISSQHSFIEFDFKIAPLDISRAVITLGKPLTYNGSKQIQEVLSVSVLGLNVTYEISGDEQINAGDYTITIKGTKNFTGTATKSYTIAKKKLNVLLDETEFIYDGTIKEYQPVDFNPETMKLSNHKQKNAGDYTVLVELKDKINYLWMSESSADIRFAFNIAKISITVEADDKIVIERSDAASLTYQVLAGEICAGDSFTGTLSRPFGTSPGTYPITQGTLTLGDNYTMQFIEGTYTIKARKLNSSEDTIDSSISMEGGFLPNAIWQIEESKDFSQFSLASKLEIKHAYMGKVVMDGKDVSLSNPVTIKLKIPEALKEEKDVKLIFAEQDELMDIVREGDYFVFETADLGMFGFVTKKSSLAFWIVLLVVMNAALIGYCIYIILKRYQKKKLTTTNSFVFLPLFGSLITSHLVTVILMAILAAGLITFIVLLKIKEYKEKKIEVAKRELLDEIKETDPNHIINVLGFDEQPVEAKTVRIEGNPNNYFVNPLVKIVYARPEYRAQNPEQVIYTQEIPQAIPIVPSEETIEQDEIEDFFLDLEEEVNPSINEQNDMEDFSLNLDDDFEENFEEEETDFDSEEDEEVEEESTGQMIVIHYRKSFTARLCQADDFLKQSYAKLKNQFLSYHNVKSRMSFVCDSINSGRTKIGKFAIRGKKLWLYLAILPEEGIEIDASIRFVEQKAHKDTPCLIRIKKEKQLLRAMELITMVCEKHNLLIKENYQHIDIVNEYPFESNDVLLEKGFIKQIIVRKEKEPLKEQTHDRLEPPIRKAIISVHEVSKLISDEDAKKMIEWETSLENKDVKRMKEIINIDLISDSFLDDEIVNIESLKEKNILRNTTTYYKVLARGSIDKKLTIVANDFSLEAVKMIVLLGGRAIRIKE